ncbi:PQQ-binding-like beta-propeller repeat protein [Micromonospora sp. C31]|uniref:outer membrane protein assembly factor BamB family protein n=1 Tax=Micromonospora sp. C31 TaxID=2824876 RepID=UPI001B373F2F|nr:PQQ-binding-like beta-propeller repeat protein [Micromonospora sp. C31]MBQ1073629.1 PQQ-binding-like beta-propeller repeat protein [Micromonospora sp. C31]
MTVIDLGELRDEPDREAPPPRAVGRPLRVALALAFLVATVAAAAPVPTRVALVVPARLGAEVFLDAGRIYVVEPAEGEPAGTVEVRAYALPERAPADGTPPTPAWRARVVAASRFWQVQTGPGTVLFSITGDHDDGQTIALDDEDGRERWRQPGYPWWDPTGILLMRTGGEESGAVRSVDPASGRALWSVPVTGESVRYAVRDGRVERIVLAPAKGRVEVRDPRSGALTHAADLRLGELPGYGYSVVAHDLLLVVRPAAGVVTAYGLDGLRRRWEARLSQVEHVNECGELLCAPGASGSFSVLDPTTGVLRWTGQRWAGVLSARGDRLLALAPGGVGDRFGVLDAATGREVADLGTWQLMPWYEEQRLLAVRPAVAGGGLVVAELDVAAGRARVLDVLRDASSDCRSRADTMVCRLDTGDFGVWRYPR